MHNNNLQISANTQLKLNNFFSKIKTHYIDKLTNIIWLWETWAILPDSY